MSVNEQLLDYQIARAIRWLRMGERKSRQVVSVLKEVDDSLARLLASSSLDGAPYSAARAENLRVQIEAIINAVHAKIKSETAASALETAKETAAEELAEWQKILPAGIDVITPNPGVLATMIEKPYTGGRLEEWAEQLRRGDVQRTWYRVRQGMIEGQTTDEIIRGVRGSKSLNYKDGVRQVTRRGAQAFVRTAINHGANSGRQAMWDANSDLIKGVQWVSTLDTRTSPICRARDGELFPVDSGPRPPAHPNCRSTTVSVLKSAEELGIPLDKLPPGTRASMNGQVPATQTYYDWLKRQPVSVQKEVLGKRDFDAWQASGKAPDFFKP